MSDVELIEKEVAKEAEKMEKEIAQEAKMKEKETKEAAKAEKRASAEASKATKKEKAAEKKAARKAKKEEKKAAKKAMTPEEKKRRKKIIRRSVLGAFVVLVLGFVVYSKIAASNYVMPVSTQKAERQTLQEDLSTSGMIESEETKSYFSPVSLEVSNVAVAAGDTVKKGDVLIQYDEEALADEIELTNLKLQAGEGGYDSSIYKNNRLLADLHEANVNLPVLEQQIADSENYLKILEGRLADKKAALAREGALLQVSLIECDSWDTETYENLQKAIQYNSYEQQNNKELRQIQEEIDEYRELISGYKEYKSEMKAQKNSSESSIMDQGGKSQIEANIKTEEISTKEALQDTEKAKDGIKADFNGVVTEVTVVNGETPAKGSKLVTLQSTEKVHAKINLSKYDLEKVRVGQLADITIAGNTYEGEITKINGMATANANGAPVVGAEIQLKNPDNNIFLGVEAKVQLHIAEAKDVLVVPLEVVNVDTEGEFVYVVEDGKVAKKRIVTCVSSDLYCEVKEGLTEDDEIISDMSLTLEEGTAVQSMPVVEEAEGTDQ